MGLLSIFGSNKGFDADKFERHLKQLTISITKTERDIQRLSKNGNRLRRITLFYLIVIYSVYTAFIITTGNIKLENVVIVLTSPVVIVIINYVSKIINSKRISFKESKLEKLKESHQTKIDELKNLTNFNRTQSLLLKFSNGENIDYLVQQEEELIKKQKLKLQKLEDGKTSILDLSQSSSTDDDTLSWYDRLMRFILGNDEFEPNNRYALICYNCFNHNGLAFPNQLPSEVQYICPRCGAFNGKHDTDVSKEHQAENNIVVPTKNSETEIAEDKMINEDGKTDAEFVSNTEVEIEIINGRDSAESVSTGDKLQTEHKARQRKS